MEEEILGEFLEKAAESARKEIREKGTLSVENAVPFLLKIQMNDIRHLREKMTTKDDLRGMATKDDIVNMATKDDIVNMATKDDIVNMATKDDLRELESKMATKDDLRELANSFRYWLMFGVALLGIGLPLVMVIIHGP